MQRETYETQEPLVPELEQFEEQFEQFEEDLLELTDSLSDEQLVWKPSKKIWSIAECLDHLNVTGFELLPGIDQAVVEGERQSLTRSKPWKGKWMGRLMVRSMEPPARLKVKAPSLFTPRWPNEPRKVVRELVELQGELIKRLHEANGLDLGALKIRSPAFRWLKLSLGDWFAATAAHQRRHLWQASGLPEEEGFPA